MIPVDRLSEGTCTVQRSDDKPVYPILQTCQEGQPNFVELPEVQSMERERERERERYRGEKRLEAKAQG